MFFYLSKLLSFLLSPLVWVFALLLWSMLSSNERRNRRLRWAAAIVLYVCSNSFIVDECFRAYEPVTEDHENLDRKYQAAIVLGGLGDIDLRLKKITFGYSGDRLFQTLPLYYEGRVERIIFTGGSGSIEFPEKREGIFVQRYLRRISFPDSALIVESTSRNTYENARNTRALIDSLGMEGPFLLVTSAYHMPRTLAVFKKAGITNVRPFITNKSSGLRRFTFDHLFIPNPVALTALEKLLHELVGFAVYKIKGYA